MTREGQSQLQHGDKSCSEEPGQHRRETQRPAEQEGGWFPPRGAVVEHTGPPARAEVSRTWTPCGKEKV